MKRIGGGLKRMAAAALFLLLLGFTDNAATAYGEISISLLPLNITADSETTGIIRKTIPPFLMQRLNTSTIKTTGVLSELVFQPEILNGLYSGLQTGRIDDRLIHNGPAGYYCGGSIVVLGNSVVADFTLWKSASGTKVVAHSFSGTDVGAVLKAADAFTLKTTAFLTGHTDNSVLDVTPVYDTNETIQSTTRSADTAGLIKSSKVTGEISAVVFCNRGSGNGPAILYALPDRVVALGISGSGFSALAEIKNRKHEKIIGLVAADTDGDGVDEVIVSNIRDDNRTISSFVLAWEDGRLKRRAEGLKWIFASGPTGLLVQKNATLKTTLDSGIYHAGFQNGTLVVTETPVKFPRWVKLPGLVMNSQSKPFHAAAFYSDFRLRFIDSAEEIFWESSDSFGGSATYLSEEDPHDTEIVKRIWLGTPVIQADIVSGNAYSEILAVKNQDTTRNLFQRLRSFKDGKLVVLAVSELGCREIMETETISGYISGFDLDHQMIVYSVVGKGKTLFSKKKSYLVVQPVASLKRTD